MDTDKHGFEDDIVAADVLGNGLTRSGGHCVSGAGTACPHSFRIQQHGDKLSPVPSRVQSALISALKRALSIYTTEAIP